MNPHGVAESFYVFWLEHMHYRHVKTLLARRERYIAVYGSGWNKSLLSGSP